MSEIKKAQGQEELFRTIYKIATDLVHAGHVAEWDFKSYVLGTMFYRYISENFAEYINKGERDAGNPDFDYSLLEHLLLDDNNAVWNLCCQLCTACEHKAFIDGLQYGAHLMQNLK